MISPLLCNVYLHRIDRVWDVREHGVLVRFADDALVMCKSREQAEAALARLRSLWAELGLEPKEAKTRIVHLQVGGAGFDFLGFHPGQRHDYLALTGRYIESFVAGASLVVMVASNGVCEGFLSVHQSPALGDVSCHAGTRSHWIRGVESPHKH